ncbi:Tyrosyl-DNA phosphodiesterase 2 [Dinochytrium kinnereticum]|nr:Tyrosyl-DNA phosphodiesterase 2 [Dinochytrium kinnereticum]
MNLVNRKRPHFLALQEISQATLRRIENETTFQLLGTAKSHCLEVATFVDMSFIELGQILDKHELPEEYGSLASQFDHLPISITPFRLFSDDTPSVFINCHLPPFADGAQSRFDILHSLSNTVLPVFSQGIICGDMNMREAETSSVCKLGVKDAFLLAKSPKDHKFTFDSLENEFHPKEGSFPGFRCRFDRIFLMNMGVKKFELVKGELHSAGVKAFISDHYGIFACIQ